MGDFLSQKEIDQMLTAIKSGNAEDESGEYESMEMALLKSENRRLRCRLKICDIVFDMLRKIAAAALTDE